MGGLNKILNTIKTRTELLSAKLQVKGEGYFGSRKVAVGDQKISLKELIPRINTQMEGLLKKLENPNLNSSELNQIKEETQVLHEFINKTKELNPLEKLCFGLFSKIFGKSTFLHINTSRKKLSSLSNNIQEKLTTIVNTKSLLLDKTPTFDVLNLKRAGISNILREFSAIESEMQQEINNLPAVDQVLANEKLAILKEMAEYATDLKQYNFKPQIIEKLIIYRIELKNEGISSSLPETLGLDPNNPAAAEKGLIVDANGKPFDNLRKNNLKPEGDSAAEKIEAFCASRGGDYRFVNNWLKNQSTDSWSPESRYVKNIFSSFRNVDPNKIWDGPPLDLKMWGLSEAESRNITTINQRDAETLLMHLAFTHELLTKIDFPGKNKDGTVTMYRTESKEVLELNGITEVSDEKEHHMNRGFDGSFSIIAPFSLQGTEITEQRMPIVLIEASFLTKRMLKDEEKEFVCMSDDVPFKYTHSIPPKAKDI